MRDPGASCALSDSKVFQDPGGRCDTVEALPNDRSKSSSD